VNHESTRVTVPTHTYTYRTDTSEHTHTCTAHENRLNSHTLHIQHPLPHTLTHSISCKHTAYPHKNAHNDKRTYTYTHKQPIHMQHLHIIIYYHTMTTYIYIHRQTNPYIHTHTNSIFRLCKHAFCDIICDIINS